MSNGHEGLYIRIEWTTSEASKDVFQASDLGGGGGLGLRKSRHGPPKRQRQWDSSSYTS